jgi:hypothetical protein
MDCKQAPPALTLSYHPKVDEALHLGEFHELASIQGVRLRLSHRYPR